MDNSEISNYQLQITNGEGGFSMIETLVAMMILVIISSAIVAMILALVSANTSAKLRNQAVGYAEEGIEQVRNYFQANGWQSLNNQASNKCYTDGTLASQVACPASADCVTGPIPSSVFFRYVWLTQGASQVKVQSIVSWRDRSVCLNSEVDTIFFSY